MKNIIFSKGERHVREIQKKIQLGGVGNMHILADFDRTLTKNFIKGKEKPSLVSVLRNEGILGDVYSRQAYDLYNKFHPIEIDSTVSRKEKKNAMSEWWQTHMQLIVDSGLQKKHVSTAVNAGNIQFRDGIEDFLSRLKKHNIPLVIISANAMGTDSIRDFLMIHDLYGTNIHIVSNEFIWDENGYAIDYNKNVIHTFNKDETVLEKLPHIYNAVKKRRNVILLGDSQGDPGMVTGFNTENILKIGFLNKNKEKLEAVYRKIYDVIITDDGDLSFVNDFLKKLN